MEANSLREKLVDPDLPWVYLAFALFGLTGHAIFALFQGNPVLEGEIFDTDGYMHLIRARELYETSDWYNNVIERVNPPYGLVLHWTRIFDVLLLALAVPLTIFLTPSAALHWAALAVLPLVHVASACAVCWAAKPLIPSVHRLWILPIFFFQGSALSYSLAGRVDHHGLLVLMGALSIGATLRLLAEPERRGMAVVCGILHGIGLWWSVEFLLIVLLDFAAVAVFWGAFAGAFNRAALWLSLGALLAITIYLPVERSPAMLLVVEHDRISVFHAFFMALAAAIWCVPNYIVRTLHHALYRWIFLGAGTVVGLGFLSVFFPEFHRGPMAGIDPRVTDLLVAHIAEMRSILRWDLEGARAFIWSLGGAIVAVPMAVWIVLRGRDERNRIMWWYLAACLAVLLILGLQHVRLSVYSEIPIAIFVADLLRRVSVFLAKSGSIFVSAVGTSYLSIAVIAGPLIASHKISDLRASTRQTSVQSKQCTFDDVRAAIDAVTSGDSEAPMVILTASTAFGPPIVYFTRHSIINAPYHRNVRGILDTAAVWNATDDLIARDVIAERDIALLMLCKNAVPANLQDAADNPRSLYSRLKSERDVPAWLAPVAAGHRDLKVYRVIAE